MTAQPNERALQALGLGPQLRRAWVGYQRRLDRALAAEGFDDRAFPDGRVLRMCRDVPGTTISAIGRELGITRQGAAKIVSGLRERGYVTVEPSATSGREKVVDVTARALEYLAAHRRAARGIESDLRNEVGADAFEAVQRLVTALAGEDDTRLRDYLRSRAVHEL